MKKLLFPIVLLILILLSGCQKKLGYGILYWSADESLLTTGTALTIYSESNITDTYLVSPRDEKEKQETDKWRVALFPSDSDFQEAYGSFKTFADTYADCQKNLPLREEPSSSAKNIYKLQEGQTLKVIGREEEKVTIGNLEGYWYKLLTSDGVIGYTFDYYLTVYNKNTDGTREVLNERVEDNIFLDNVVNAYWRPDYYRSMLSRNMIDMNSFRDEFYLYINGETNTITMKTYEREVSVNYEKISNTAYQSYAFLGTTFRIEINSDTHMSVQYNFEDREYKEAFVRLSTPVEDILRITQEARDEILFSFIDNGPVYSSRSYGDLEFEEGGRFTWIKKTSLISRKVISSAAGNSGRISFNLFPDPSIEEKYDGGFYLTFSNGEKLYFLYTYKENGIQLLHIPPKYINKQSVVTADNFYDPLTMFFSAPVKEDSSQSSESTEQSS